jgi:hypothetical protein
MLGAVLARDAVLARGAERSCSSTRRLWRWLRPPGHVPRTEDDLGRGKKVMETEGRSTGLLQTSPEKGHACTSKWLATHFPRRDGLFGFSEACCRHSVWRFLGTGTSWAAAAVQWAAQMTACLARHTDRCARVQTKQASRIKHRGPRRGGCSTVANQRQPRPRPKPTPSPAEQMDHFLPWTGGNLNVPSSSSFSTGPPVFPTGVVWWKLAAHPGSGGMLQQCSRTTHHARAVEGSHLRPRSLRRVPVVR